MVMQTARSLIWLQQFHSKFQASLTTTFLLWNSMQIKYIMDTFTHTTAHIANTVTDFCSLLLWSHEFTWEKKEVNISIISYYLQIRKNQVQVKRAL